MLTILHPNLIPYIQEFAGGLMLARAGQAGKLLLIVKAHKEYILAARMRGGFSFYLAPLPCSQGLTVALATAFFDDGDEPLVVRTPILDEPMGKELLELLAYKELEVYFLDEHGREWMSYRASIHDGGSLLATGEKFELLPYHPRTVDSIYHALDTWFGHRSAEDDDKAIRIAFEESLSPSDLLVIDVRADDHNYHGSGGYSHSSLERENPGYFQERDIVTGLKRTFPGHHIALNPLRRDTGNELVDVMAWTDTHLILVQAKDSPNTEASLMRSIDRKRRASQGQIDKAVKQTKGAIAYVREHPILGLTIQDNEIDFEVGSRKIVSLVIVQEMFTVERDAFLARYLEMEGIGDVFVLLDYAAFISFCHEFTNESALIEALTEYSNNIRAERAWVDPRTFVLDRIQDRLTSVAR